MKFIHIISMSLNNKGQKQYRPTKSNSSKTKPTNENFSNRPRITFDSVESRVKGGHSKTAKDATGGAGPGGK